MITPETQKIGVLLLRGDSVAETTPSYIGLCWKRKPEMHINSICVERGRRLGLIVTTITPLEATLPWPCSPHLPLSPSVPSQMPGAAMALRPWDLGRIFTRCP